VTLTSTLLDYGFDNFLKYDFNTKGNSVPFTASVEGGEVEDVSLHATETISLLLSSNERKRLEIWPQIPALTGAPIKAEQKLGTLEYWLDGKMLKQVALQTEFAVPEQSILSELTSMLINLGDTN